MKTKVEYYADIADKAVNLVNVAYDRMLIGAGLDEDEADKVADESTKEVCDLSPYQLADFIFHEYDPYEDYSQYDDDYDEAEYYKHVASCAISSLIDLFKCLYSILGIKDTEVELLTIARIVDCLKISQYELDCFMHKDGDPYAEYTIQEGKE